MVGKCEAFKMKFKMIRLQGTPGEGKFTDIVDSNSDTPSCLLEQLKKAYKDCSKHYTAPNGEMANYYTQIRWVDDCVLRAFTDPLEFWEQTGMKQFRSGTNYTTNDLLNVRVANDEYTSFYFDKECSILENQNVPEERICLAAKVTYYASPISLLLNPLYEDLSEKSVIAKFKLSPGSADYVIWKASESAPLLVYDPTHSGVVASYSQLFGEWTFGGRAEASLVKSETDQTSSRVAWQDGYSALETLDTNMDGKVAGEELLSLSLWFDGNRNAISEPGEVRSVESEGIRALYYKNKVKNELNGDLRVELGFEREVGNKLVTGSSVDWYGVVGDTETELVQRNNTLRALCQSGPVAGDAESEDLSSEIASVVAPDPGFAGVWVWQSNDSDPSKVVGGVISLSSSEDGKYKGASAIEVSASESEAKFSSVVSTFGLRGALVKSGKYESNDLIFTIKSNDGVRLESKVALSEDKTSLSGHTWAVKGVGEGKQVLAQYSWVASRFKD